MRRAAAAAAAAARGAASAIRHAGSSAAAEFPRHPSELSATWLTAALTEAGRIPRGATVSAFTGEQIGAGVGLASLLHRLTLQVEPPAGSGAPREHISAVAKFAPTEKEALAMASRLGSFKRECGFYAALAAAPASARAAAPESGASPPAVLPAAPAWFARHDSARGGACLLFEDLAAASPPWVPGDQVAGASLAAARATLRSAAALHAAYWRHPQLAKWSGARGWLPRLDAELFVSFDSAQFAASWPRWRARFPAAATALPFGVVLAFDADPSRFERAARRLLTGLAREPCTLLHGDLRFDNVFLRHDASNQTHARFIDMGDCAAGRSMFDVAYFLSMSVETQLRRAHEAELLSDYSATLAQHLEASGATDAAIPSAEEAMADYRAASAYVFCLAVNLGGSEGLAEGSERRRRLAVAMAARAAAALSDAGEAQLLQADEVAPPAA